MRNVWNIFHFPVVSPADLRRKIPIVLQQPNKKYAPQPPRCNLFQF